MAPPAQDRWLFLAGIPKVMKDKEAKRIFPPGTDISVACNELPRASLLTVPFRVFSPACLHNHPYVATADSSGLLLLCATEPNGALSSLVTYHLCDACTGGAVCLRVHDRTVGFHGKNIGLMTKNGGCVVAELQPAGDGTGRAMLLCYTVGEYRWVEQELAYSPPLHQDWVGEGVVSYAGMLWWVDLSYTSSVDTVSDCVAKP